MTISPLLLRDEFSQRFGATARLFRAPGRVNLIGEHTDYNEGFVLPAALDRSTWIAVAARSDRRLRIISRAMTDTVEVDLDAQRSGRSNHWADYVVGVAVLLEQNGYHLAGANLLIDSNVPIGSGLSSSAALEVATASALLAVSELKIDRLALVRICQQAENEFVGARCGIMDQFISVFGEPNKALLLDCRSLEKKLISVPESMRIVVCNTMVKHAISGGEYNLRRQQ
jgi:galactokinase